MGWGLDVRGLEHISEVALALLEARRDTSSPRRLIGEEMLLRTHDNWTAGRAPDGSSWPASARAMGFGGQTMLRTGKLFASVTYELAGEDLVLFSDDKRARAHHEGLTITPKPGHRALAIPMSDAVASAHREGVSIREQYPDGFLIVSEAGNAFIVRSTGGGATSFLGGLEFLYKLVDHVKEPERPLLGFGEDDGEMAVSYFVKHFASAEQRAGGH